MRVRVCTTTTITTTTTTITTTTTTTTLITSMPVHESACAGYEHGELLLLSLLLSRLLSLLLSLLLSPLSLVRAHAHVVEAMSMRVRVCTTTIIITTITTTITATIITIITTTSTTTDRKHCFETWSEVKSCSARACTMRFLSSSLPTSLKSTGLLAFFSCGPFGL